VTSTRTGIACGTRCRSAFPVGTRVTLVARPASGAAFRGWGGACAGRAMTCAVALHADARVTASFSRPLSVTALTVLATHDGGVYRLTVRLRLGRAATADLRILRGARLVAHRHVLLPGGLRRLAQALPRSARPGRYDAALRLRAADGATRTLSRTVLLR
jgi:hypothetical protein